MKSSLFTLLSLVFVSIGFTAPFKPVSPDERYGVVSSSWRFASDLSQDADGTIELCYAEEGSAVRVLGRVEVRPFRSSDTKVPDLRILFAPAEVDGKRKIVLLVGYGIRSGVFIADVPSLTTHSLSISSTPHASASGEFTLLGFGDGAVTIKSDGSMVGVRGRLFFRYVEKT
jgi:hypothetical protein